MADPNHGLQIQEDRAVAAVVASGSHASPASQSFATFYSAGLA